jgi:methylisocitrate lyase
MSTTRISPLHETGCFVIPNPWDAGSARLLERLGFKALATTSSGIAWSLGMRDNHVPLDLALKRIDEICASTSLPVNADFEGGFAVDPPGVATNVRRVLATGCRRRLDRGLDRRRAGAALRIRARGRARACRGPKPYSGTGVLLTARSEGLHRRPPGPRRNTEAAACVRRGRRRVPVRAGLRDHSHIRAVVEAVRPKPVNALVHAGFATFAQMEAIGVRRISVGWRARARGVDRLPRGRARDQGPRHVRSARQDRARFRRRARLPS